MTVSIDSTLCGKPPAFLPSFQQKTLQCSERFLEVPGAPLFWVERQVRPPHPPQADAAFLPLFFPDDPTLGRGVYYVAGYPSSKPRPNPCL